MDTQNSSKTNSIQLSNLQRTYTGLLDDVMIRYSDDYSNERFFNKMIAKNIFFGGGLYINDGYLINHPTARRYLTDENSILRHMIDNGFVRILTRASTPEKLISMPEEMVKNGITSFQHSMNEIGWIDPSGEINENNEFRKIWIAISQSSFHRGHARGWPPVDMGAGFTKLVQKTLAEKESPEQIGFTLIQKEDLAKFQEIFLQKDPQLGAARTKFEDAASETFETKENKRSLMNEIMTLANQAYHSNFGMVLTANDQELNPVGVDTVYDKVSCQVLKDYLDITEVYEDQLYDVPLFWLPDDISFEDGSAFLPFLRDTNKIGIAKQEYLQALSEVIERTDRGSEDRKKDLQEATHKYMTYIANHLGSQQTESLLLGSSSSSLSMRPSYVENTAYMSKNIPGLVVGLHQDGGSKSSQNVLLKQFILKDIPEEQLIRLKDIRAQISSLTFNKAKSEDFISDLPKFT